MMRSSGREAAVDGGGGGGGDGIPIGGFFLILGSFVSRERERMGPREGAVPR